MLYTVRVTVVMQKFHYNTRCLFVLVFVVPVERDVLHGREGGDDEPRRYSPAPEEGQIPRAGNSAEKAGDERATDIQGAETSTQDIPAATTDSLSMVHGVGASPPYLLRNRVLSSEPLPVSGIFNHAPTTL